MFDAYKTPLTPKEEIAYQLAKANSPFANNIGYDYDLRGFWKQYGNLSPQATNGHLTDEYKLPWHETYSIQSRYYNGETYAINPNGYTYLPDRLDDDFIRNGLQPYRESIF